MNQASWSHFPHSADIGVKGVGRSLSQAFEQAALALFAAVTDLGEVAATSMLEVHCRAQDDKILLVDWLNALIYESGVKKMVFSRFEVEVSGGCLKGRAWGEPMDPHRHRLVVEPKGATFTELKVERTDDGTWIAQCVVDV